MDYSDLLKRIGILEATCLGLQLRLTELEESEKRRKEKKVSPYRSMDEILRERERKIRQDMDDIRAMESTGRCGYVP